jgi:hypothetical protein
MTMSTHKNSERRRGTSHGRNKKARIKKVLLAGALVALITAFYTASNSINVILPEILATRGYSESANFLTTTITAGMIAGFSTLFAGIVDRSRRGRKGPVWSPYGIRGTANARRCKSYSITAHRTSQN